MKQFLTKIFIFTLLTLVADRAFYYVLLSQRPHDVDSFIVAKQSFFNNNQTCDILIIGDSHIAYSVDPRTIKSTCGLNAFNLGVNASGPHEWYYILQNALSHLSAPPKIVLIGTSENMFHRKISKGTWTRLILSNMFFKLKFASETPEGVEMSDTFFCSLREKFVVPKDRNGFPDFSKLFRSNPKKPRRTIESVYNGHLEFYDHEGKTWSNFSGPSGLWGTSQGQQVEYFKKTLQLLEDRKIKTIIVNSPIWFPLLDHYKKTQNSFWQLSDTLQEISDKFRIKIYNEDHNVLRGKIDRDEFFNTTHLNYSGSVKFTTHLSHYLDSQLK